MIYLSQRRLHFFPLLTWLSACVLGGCSTAANKNINENLQCKVFSCPGTAHSGTDPDLMLEDGPEHHHVTAYLTCGNGDVLFEKQMLEYGKPDVSSSEKIVYDKKEILGEVDGFGFAITTATGYNLLQMSPEDRHAELARTFSPTEGVGSSLIRVAVGASDFCLKEEYSWCDRKGADNFKVAKEDRQYLFPVLREIYEINPDVKIIASPWSAPRWMKGYVSDTFREVPYPFWRDGRLRPSYYEAYAEYLVKWVLAMEKEGFDIYAMTMQNEPLNHGNSISMYMPWKDQRDFIKVLGPAMKKNGLGKVKLLLFDHNYNYDNHDDQYGYPIHIFNDPDASRWAAGSAWHDYGGSVSELDNIVQTFPEKEIYFTESSIGTWNYDKNGQVGGNFENVLLGNMHSIFFGTLSRGGRGVTYWNYMLDDKMGPHSRHPGACTSCYGGVTISSEDYRKVTPNSQWYNMAHASKVIRPGARRIRAEGYEQYSDLLYLMYLNQDGTVSAIVLNEGEEDRAIVFSNDCFSVSYTIPKRSLASLIWQE